MTLTVDLVFIREAIFTPIQPAPATTPVCASREGSMLEHDDAVFVMLRSPRASPNSVADLVVSYDQKTSSDATAKYLSGSKQEIVDETLSRAGTAPSAAPGPLQLPNQIADVDDLVPDATAAAPAAAPLVPSRCRPIGKRSVYAERAANCVTPALSWVPYQRAGKFMMVAAATSTQWGVQTQRAPEYLLAEIAKHTPQHQAGYVLRQPARTHTVTPTTTAHHEDDVSKSAPICSRVQPVNAQLVNAGLLGAFVFDPNAWQCCNTAKANGWRMYQDHACAHCKQRAAAKCNRHVP